MRMNVAKTTHAEAGIVDILCRAYAITDTVNAMIDQTRSTGGRLRMMACPESPKALLRAL